MIIKDQPYDEYVKQWLERDAKKEWLESRPGVIAMVDHIVSLIGNLDGYSILDAGAKEGWTGDYLREKFTGIDITSAELLQSFVDYGRTMGRMHLVQADICQLPRAFNTKFDLVICRHVLGLVSDIPVCVNCLHRASRRFVYILTHIPGNTRKHYSYLHTPEEFRALFDELPVSFRFFGPNPKQFRYQDQRRVEWVSLTEIVAQR